MVQEPINSSRNTVKQNISQTPDLRTQEELAQIRRTLNIFKRVIYTVAGLILILLIGWAAVFSYHHLIARKSSPPDPVPLTIRHGVNFNVYYPDQTKLPAGYTLDTNSF